MTVSCFTPGDSNESAEVFKNALVPGCSLSFSGRSKNPRKFRRVLSGESDRMMRLLNVYPEISQFMSDEGAPIVVNHYPAALGPIPSAVVVDTFLRQTNFSRALHLGSLADRTCIIVGQPLAVAEFLFRHIQMKHPLPQQIVIVMGGYVCPRTLEDFINHMLDDASVAHISLHGYGTAEVEYGIFIGKRSCENHKIVYQHVADHIEWKIVDNVMHLRCKSRKDWFCTSDYAYRCEGGLEFRNSSTRLSDDIIRMLESWTPKEWVRRTGYLGRDTDTFYTQCRCGVEPTGSSEVEFYDFCREFGMSYLDKPDWS